MNSNLSDHKNPYISLCINERIDSSVRLELCAVEDGFCVTGSAYFDNTVVADFVSELRKFPLGYDPGPFVSSGYFNDTGSVLETETVHISVSQITKSGLLAMAIRVFSPHFEYWEQGFGRGGRCNYFLNYEDLKKFTDDFERLVTGKTDCVKFESFLNI